MIKYLQNSEKNRIRQLYDAVFRDPKDFTDYYFSKVLPENEVLVAQEQDQIVSMLQLVKKKVMYQGKQRIVHYIYGVATDEKYRGRGLMSELMERALSDLEHQGEPFVYLVPIEPELYEKFGFHTVYKKKCYMVQEPEKVERIFSPGEKDVVVLRSISDRILPDQYDTYIVHDRNYYLQTLAQLKLEGGYLVYHMAGDKLQGYSMVDRNHEVLELVSETMPEGLEYTHTTSWIMVKELDATCNVGRLFINDET